MDSSFQQTATNEVDDDGILSGTQLQAGTNRNDINGRTNMWLQESGLLPGGDGDALRRSLVDQANFQHAAGLEGFSNIASSSASLFNQSQAPLTSGLQSSAGMSLSGLASGFQGQFSQDALRSLQQQLPDQLSNNGSSARGEAMGTAPWMAQSARMLNLDPTAMAFNNAQRAPQSNDTTDNPLRQAEKAFLASLRGEGPSTNFQGQQFPDFATNLQFFGQQQRQLNGSALTGLHQDDASNGFSSQNFALNNISSHQFPSETAQKLLQQEYANNNALQSLNNSRTSTMPQVLRSLQNLGANGDMAALRTNLNLMSNANIGGHDALLAALQQDRKLDLGIGGGFQFPSLGANHQSLLSMQSNADPIAAGTAARNLGSQQGTTLHGNNALTNLLKTNSDYGSSSGLSSNFKMGTTTSNGIGTSIGGDSAGEVSLFLNGKNVLIEPNCHDVLLGRGNFTNKHEGNVKFRSLVSERKAYYNSLTGKEEKMKVARKLIDHIASLDPPGRFLMQDDKTMLWYEADMGKAIAKTRQALREGFRSANRKKALPNNSTDDG